MALEKAITSEGLRVYVDTIPTAETANIKVFVGAGSVHEPDELAGISHALEHCVHVTDMFPTRQSLRDYDGVNSIISNADTTNVRTTYYGIGPYVDPIMKRHGEILFRASYDPEYIASEMSAINREARMCLDTIDNVHYVAADYGLFGKPYGRDVIGYSDRLNFTPEQLRDYYKQRYTLANMAVVAVGNARIEEILQGVEQYFEYSSGSVPHVDLPKPTSLQARTTGLLRKDSENARITVSTPMDKAFAQRYLEREEMYYAAIEAIRNQCFESLRNQAGISYDGGAGFATFNHRDAWAIQGNVTTDAENIDQARSIFDDVLSRPSSTYSDQKIASALGSIRSKILIRMDTVIQRTDLYFNNLEADIEPTDARALAENVRNLSHEDVRATIDHIVGHIAINDSMTHITGPLEAIRSVDQMIEQSTIA